MDSRGRTGLPIFCNHVFLPMAFGLSRASLSSRSSMKISQYFAITCSVQWPFDSGVDSSTVVIAVGGADVEGGTSDLDPPGLWWHSMAWWLSMAWFASTWIANRRAGAGPRQRRTPAGAGPRWRRTPAGAGPRQGRSPANNRCNSTRFVSRRWFHNKRCKRKRFELIKSIVVIDNKKVIQTR